MNWKEKTSILVGLVIFGLIMFDGYSECSLSPEEVQVTIDNAVEELSLQREIEISEKGYLTNQFSEYRGFAGAGGMGNNVIGAKNITDFMITVQNKDLEIYYSFEREEYKFTKRYWALSPMGVHELKYVYTAPVQLAIYYYPEEYNNNAVIFKKGDMSGPLLMAFFWGVMMGIIGFVALFCILVICQLIYNKIVEK